MGEDLSKNHGIAGKSLQPTAKANGNAYKSFEAATTIQLPQNKNTIQDSIDALHNKNELKTIRTFQSDIAEAVKQKGTSVATIAIAEQKKDYSKQAPSDPKRNAVLLFLSILLIVGSGMAVSVYTIIHVFLKTEQAIVPQNEQVLISTEKTQPIYLNNDESIIDALHREYTVNNTSNNTFLRIKYYTATTTELQNDIKKLVPPKALDGKAFINKLSVNTPPELIRTIEPLYSTGVHSSEANTPYIIIKTNSYEGAFSGMLAWESTLKNDLADYYSTFTNDSSLLFQEGNFTDKIIKNKNVRVFTTQDGTTSLMYAFHDKQTIVITWNEITLTEIFSRLGTSQFIR